MIWQRISSWCKLQPIYVFSVKDLLQIHGLGNWCERKKEAIHAMILTAMWCIWKDRNEFIVGGFSFLVCLVYLRVLASC
ncbi:hypothetical protein R6Q57_003948 [Mikania cordata]